MNLCLSNQGCYSSICEDGMLKIIIENATFTCHEAGQVIDVALVKAEEWLHEGSIICPSCTVGNLTFFTFLFYFEQLFITWFHIFTNLQTYDFQFDMRVFLFLSEMQKKTFKGRRMVSWRINYLSLLHSGKFNLFLQLLRPLKELRSSK